MTRWYPVPIPMGNKVIFKIYNSEGHFVADACDEATATHIADLHNADLRVTEITDEDYRGDWPKGHIPDKPWYSVYQPETQDGWIPWNGGGMPVPKGTLVDVEFRDGHIERSIPAGETSQGERSAISWLGGEGPHAIAAYRLAEPGQDEPVAAVWLGDSNIDISYGGVYKFFDHPVGSNSKILYDNRGDAFYPNKVSQKWQLLYPGKVYAQAPLSVDRYYLTPGKCYEAIEDDGEAFSFYTDEGYFYDCTMWEGAAPLDFKNWTRIIPENL